MKIRASIFIVCIFILLEACAGPERKPAVPELLTLEATIPGLPGVRYRMGIEDRALIDDGLHSLVLEQARLEANLSEDKMPPISYLAVSGGGDNGAFGAGLLNGWTVAGNRPEFKLVTGVSTGALIAPYAFLGSEYDNRLKDFYTNISAKDVMELRTILSAVTSDAIADNRRLW